MKLDIVKDRSILIDTSVWIDYFKGNDAQFQNKVDEVLRIVLHFRLFIQAPIKEELLSQGRKGNN